MSEQLDEAVEQFSRVALVARALTDGLDAAEVIDIVVCQGMVGLDAEGGVLALLGSDGVIVPAVTVGYPKEVLAAIGPLTIDRDLPLTTAARENVPVWISSPVDGQARFPALTSVPTRSQAWAAIPLVANGSVFGVLGVSFLTPREFSDAERLFLCTLADLSALALATCRPVGVVAQSPATDVGRSDDRQLGAEVIPLLDRAMSRVLGTSRQLAVIMSRHRVEDDVAQMLSRGIDELDALGHEIQSAAFTLQAPGS